MSRKVVAFSGAVLVLISLLWILPELVQAFGPSAGLAILLASLTFIWFIDRKVYPICPSCAHTHNHDACPTSLHGFAPPLIAAAIIHSFFDGWMFAYGQASTHPAISIGVLIHKLPECIAFGAILRAALKLRWHAIVWSFVSQLPLPVGALLQPAAAVYLGPGVLGTMLALGGGTFLYLGFHAMHGEWRRQLAHRAVRSSRATRLRHRITKSDYEIADYEIAPTLGLRLCQSVRF
ncbi:MAG: ZIP family metal transporter [Bryobacteraceae bacterium]